MLKLLPLLAPLLLLGCSTPQKIVHELKNDPATVRARIPTPWGVVEIDRTAPLTNSMPHSIDNGRISAGEKP